MVCFGFSVTFFWVCLLAVCLMTRHFSMGKLSPKRNSLRAILYVSGRRSSRSAKEISPHNIDYLAVIWVKLLQLRFNIAPFSFIFLLLLFFCFYARYERGGSLTFFEVCTATLPLSLGIKLPIPNGNALFCVAAGAVRANTMKCWPIIGLI